MSHGHAPGGHGAEGENKWVAICVSVLALFLAIAETLGKGAQTNSISYNVEASNLWSFYQAKTIRQTTLKTASEQMAVDVARTSDAATKQILEKRIADWKADIERYQSEPKASGGEGRKELQERAVEAGKKRDLYTVKYHRYEIASAAFQIGIVLTGVYLLTHMALLLWLTGGLSVVGIGFMLMALIATGAVPH